MFPLNLDLPRESRLPRDELHSSAMSCCAARGRTTCELMGRSGNSSSAVSTRLSRAKTPAFAASALTPSELLALQAFDVAFRALSFKAASEMLHLTPSAVSHRIRKLEQQLGTPLFIRTHQAIVPTTDGEALARATGRAFAELNRVRLRSRSKTGRHQLRLKVLPLFASAYLIPRLSGFMSRHPGIDVFIENSSQNVDFEVEAFDAAISVGDGSSDGMMAQHLTEIRATPIATPQLVRKLKLREVKDLSHAVLIHVTTFPAAWRLWFDQAGQPKLKPLRTISVDTFGAAMQAAEEGAGVAIGLEPLLFEHERKGLISRPFPLAYPTGSYWLIHPRGARPSPALVKFKRWLAAELASEHEAT